MSICEKVKKAEYPLFTHLKGFLLFALFSVIMFVNGKNNKGFKMHSTTYKRVLLALWYLKQVSQMPDRVGATSYELARYLGCTPQTVTNNLLRYGRRFGIIYEEEVHRKDDGQGNTVYKRVWQVDKESPRYMFWKHSAKREYNLMLEDLTKGE